MGRRFPRLTYIGLATGRQHHAVLEVIGEDWTLRGIFVRTGLGERADWYRNIRRHPRVEIEMGRRRVRAFARRLDDPTAAAVLADYGRRNRWAIPVARRDLG